MGLWGPKAEQEERYALILTAPGRAGDSHHWRNQDPDRSLAEAHTPGTDRGHHPLGGLERDLLEGPGGSPLWRPKGPQATYPILATSRFLPPRSPGFSKPFLHLGPTSSGSPTGQAPPCPTPPPRLLHLRTNPWAHLQAPGLHARPWLLRELHPRRGPARGLGLLPGCRVPASPPPAGASPASYLATSSRRSSGLGGCSAPTMFSGGYSLIRNWSAVGSQDGDCSTGPRPTSSRHRSSPTVLLKPRPQQLAGHRFWVPHP